MLLTYLLVLPPDSQWLSATWALGPGAAEIRTDECAASELRVVSVGCAVTLLLAQLSPGAGKLLGLQ